MSDPSPATRPASAPPGTSRDGRRWADFFRFPERAAGTEPRPMSLDGRVRTELQIAATAWNKGRRREALGRLRRQAPALAGQALKVAYAGLNTLNNFLLAPLFTMLFLELRGRAHGSFVLGEMRWLDMLFAACFATEWFLGLALARRRIKFVFNLWLLIDLLSTLPVLLAQAFRSLRALRILRVMKFGRFVQLRRVKLPIGRFFKAFGIAASATLAGAIALEGIEPQTATSLSDALWWSLVTVSTVGYGDIAPVTDQGRIIASLLIVLGLGCFSYFTGLVAATVQDAGELEILGEVQELRTQLTRVEAALERLTERAELEAPAEPPTGVGS